MTGYQHCLRCRQHLNNSFRACSLTFPASGTFGHINNRHMVLIHGYGAERTYAGTSPVTQAPVDARLVSAPGENSGPAILNAFISESFSRFAPAPLAHNPGKLGLSYLSLFSS